MQLLSPIGPYYSHLTSILGKFPDTNVIAVAHMVPNTLSFAPALSRVVNLSALLPKPKSTQRPEFSTLEKQFKCLPLTREWAQDPSAVVNALKDLGLSGQKVILIDIGGYFAFSINDIASLFPTLVGVMEGTENGVQRYERAGKNTQLSIPVLTVARSPLKLPEDYLVGSSVVFSIEATLRQATEILQSRTAAVLGYGRVGSAIAEILRGRGISTVIFDSNPIKVAEAAARGFKSYRNRRDALSASSLVVCATGNRSLDLEGFGALQAGTFVASVTSSDDEFDLPSLDAGYRKSEMLEARLTMYQENRGTDADRHFYMIANGNAANFLDGAVIGAAMQLIEGEKLYCVAELAKGRYEGRSGIHELNEGSRRLVAEVWNDHFL